MGNEEYRVGRFVLAQDDPPAWCGTYRMALAELADGRKTSDWIWYVFPQLELGTSTMSVRYAISGLDEARAYLAHPKLRDRLHRCVDAVLAAPAVTAADLMGDDDRKLRSSMTLFLRAEPEDPRYQAVLDRYFAGMPDRATDELLGLA